MPPATQRMFGPKAGATVYGLLFSGFGIASVAGGILTKVVSKKYGWEVLFQILAAMSLLATGIVSAVKPLASYSGSTI